MVNIHYETPHQTREQGLVMLVLADSLSESFSVVLVYALTKDAISGQNLKPI